MYLGKISWLDKGELMQTDLNGLKNDEYAKQGLILERHLSTLHDHLKIHWSIRQNDEFLWHMSVFYGQWHLEICKLIG